MDIIKEIDIKKAYEVISDKIYLTPIVSYEKINTQIGNNIFFKLENLQKTGAFKIRGVFNKINSLNKEEKERGVICASSGSHGIAVATVAKIYGIYSKVIVPEITPSIKIEKLKKLGEVEIYGKSYFESYVYAKKISEENNITFIHGFDDPLIIAGQGTVGIEIIKQVEDVDIIVAPIGGGGLIAGLLIARKSFFPSVKIIGVQAEGSPSMFISLNERKLCELKEIKTIAEGIAVKKPGELNFSIVNKYIDDIVLVNDNEIIEGLCFLSKYTDIVPETAGVVSFSAVLFNKLNIKNKKIVCIISGGNISKEDFLKYTEGENG